MKNCLKKGPKALEQVVNRSTESFLIQKQRWLDENIYVFEPSVKYSFKLPNNVEGFKGITYKEDVTLSNRKFSDKFFLTEDNEIVEFDHVIGRNNSFLIFGRSLQNNGNFFPEPFSSNFINIFVSNLEKKMLKILPNCFYQV